MSKISYLTPRNHYNYDNDDEYNDDDYEDEDDSNDFAKNTRNHESSGFASFGAKASSKPQSQSPGLGEYNKDRAVDLPSAWTYARLSLFDNTDPAHPTRRYLKLSLSARLRSTGKFMNFTASLAGRFRDLKRGISSELYAGIHYQNVIKAYQMLRELSPTTAIAVSKFYRSDRGRKGNSIQEFSVLVVPREQPNEYLAIVFLYDQLYEFDLTYGNFTPAQRRAGMISQTSVGGIAMIHARDIFG